MAAWKLFLTAAPDHAGREQHNSRWVGVGLGGGMLNLWPPQCWDRTPGRHEDVCVISKKRKKRAGSSGNLWTRLVDSCGGWCAAVAVPRRSLCTYTLPSGGYICANITDCISSPLTDASVRDFRIRDTAGCISLLKIFPFLMRNVVCRFRVSKWVLLQKWALLSLALHVLVLHYYTIGGHLCSHVDPL